MAQKIGVLAVCYGSRDSAMMDAIRKSPGFESTFYVFDKNRNPYNISLAESGGGEHKTGSITDIDAIVDFAKPYRRKIDFAIAGSEDPIIARLKERLKGETGIIALCPSSQLAIEKSKVYQRRLIGGACPDANPEYMVFGTNDYAGTDDAFLRYDFISWYRHLNGKAAIKPDLPG